MFSPEPLNQSQMPKVYVYLMIPLYKDNALHGRTGRFIKRYMYYYTNLKAIVTGPYKRCMRHATEDIKGYCC